MTDQLLRNNNKKAYSFLKNFRKDGYINLVAIDPNPKDNTKNVIGITRPIGHGDVVKFISDNNNVNNLYFMVNEPKSNAPDDKLKKEHVDKIHAVWLDADPNRSKDFNDERKRLFDFCDDLKQSKNAPTYITDSGGGIQAFWLLDKPVPSSDDVITHAESLSRGLSSQYDTDKVHNIDRIMRIPFTENIPTAKKKAAGRTKSTAKVLHAKSKHGERYGLKHIETFITPELQAQSEQDIKAYDMSKLKKTMPPELKKKLQSTSNKKIKELWTGKIDKPSRSEYDFTLTKELKWDGFTLDETAQILYLFPHGKGSELTGREIARCYERIDNPFGDLPQDYIDAIADQVNPITQPNKLNLNASTRLQAFDASTAQWQRSGVPLIKGLLDQNSIAIVYGQSSVGKSFVVTDIAGHIAAGKNWGTHKLKKQMGVLYICAEAGASYRKRLAALRNRLDVPEGTSIEYFPYRYVPMGVNLMTDKKDLKEIAVLSAQLAGDAGEGVGVGLIVIDTLATAFGGGNENSSEDMGKFITGVKWLQEVTGACIVIVHHAGKDSAMGARGHSSLRAATDTEIEVLSDKRGERYHRHIKTRKQREGESDVIINFGLRIDELGHDEDGDIVTTCSVVLEGESDFSDVAASPLEGLNQKEKDLIFVLYQYQMQGINPDMIKQGRSFTETQIKILLFNDYINNVGVLINKEGEIDIKELGTFAKPSETARKAFKRTWDILEEKKIDGISEGYQLLNDFLGHLGQAWDN